jgi:hypothetical protein
MSYYITKRKGRYFLFSNKRGLIGETTDHTELLKMIQRHNTAQKQKQVYNRYIALCEYLNIRIL